MIFQWGTWTLGALFAHADEGQVAEGVAVLRHPGGTLTVLQAKGLEPSTSRAKAKRWFSNRSGSGPLSAQVRERRRDERLSPIWDFPTHLSQNT